MKKVKLTRQEKQLEEALVRGEYVDVSKAEFNHIALTIAERKNPDIP